MSQWSFYDPQTGDISPKRLMSSNPQVVRDNTPEGLRAIAGWHDHLSRRVDLETGDVIDWQPPQPDADHEWNPERRRWVKRSDVRARENERARVLAEIAQLEASQTRPLRELLIDPNNVTAHTRLRAIDERIVTLRAQL